MFRRAKKGGETRRRIEARKTEPIDGTVASDERGSLAVTDKGVIFDAWCHSLSPMFSALTISVARELALSHRPSRLACIWPGSGAKLSKTWTRASQRPS